MCFSHVWGVQGTYFGAPPPGALGRGQKVKYYSILYNFNYSQFQRFLNQTLCVYSQMKDIKHIRRDFHSATWVMPQGRDLRVPRGVGGVKKNYFRNFNQSWCMSYLHEWHNFLGPPPPWGLGEGQKDQISINLNY